jgi:predicted transcriptional regulator
MTVVATSLKLPAQLKRKLVQLAEEAGESPHAFMVQALERQADALARHAAFVKDAERADTGMKASGRGYAMDEVHRYFTSRARGKPARRPRLTRWRK